jgi:dTDP-4-dehydrorhamnose reductase
MAQLIHQPDAAIVDVPMASASLVAPRPKFAALSNGKLAAQGIAMPTWQDALRRHVLSLGIS